MEFPFVWISLPRRKVQSPWKLKTENHSLTQLFEVRKQQSILAPALFRRFPENSRQNVNFQSQNTTTDCILGIPDWSELLGFTAACQLLYDTAHVQRHFEFPIRRNDVGSQEKFSISNTEKQSEKTTLKEDEDTASPPMFYL